MALELEHFSQLVENVTESRVSQTRPVLVFAMRGEGSLRSLLPWYWTDGGARPAGVFLAGYDRHDIACRTDALVQYRSAIVYHEYLHLVLRQNCVRLPTWLDERLASLFQTAQLDRGRIAMGRVDQDGLKWLSGRRPGRNRGASVESVVKAHTVIEAVASNASSWTIATGRGLPA